jgi:tRNA (cytidine/uridine-2'-O-)-methyltransferase
MRIALFQPDIPQNAGAILRLGACFGAGVYLIGPMGLVVTEKRLRRAGMDYLDLADMRQFPSFEAYLAQIQGRMVLLTTKAEAAVHEFQFQRDDVLEMGSESVGAPPEVHAAVDAPIRLPMRPGARSLNVALAAAIALWEALRQTGGLPSGSLAD